MLLRFFLIFIEFELLEVQTESKTVLMMVSVMASQCGEAREAKKKSLIEFIAITITQT